MESLHKRVNGSRLTNETFFSKGVLQFNVWGFLYATELLVLLEKPHYFILLYQYSLHRLTIVISLVVKQRFMCVSVFY